MTGNDLHKQREIFFAKFPPDQVPAATDYLQKMEEVAAEALQEKMAVEVEYQLTDHTLKDIEEKLLDHGYHLDNALMNKLRRALIHYIEETQLHNLDAPEKRLKRSQQEGYVQAWEKQSHGDHDDTPPEWREYK